MNFNTDIVCVIGEVLVDFVSKEAEVPLKDCKEFKRQVGGSCANVARFLASLGRTARLASAVGKDGLGDFLLDKLEEAGVDCSMVARMDFESTSSVVVNKTSATPQYIPYIAAHRSLDSERMDQSFLEDASIIHTNGFSISFEPLRSTVRTILHEAHEKGIAISFDPNWRRRLWPDREAAQDLIKELASISTWMKPSLDDAQELFGELPPRALAEKYLAWGCKTIVLTMGSKGSLVVDKNSCVEVAPKGRLSCATGAGDAFWSLFLNNTLAGKESVEAAQRASAEIVEHLEGETQS